MEALKNSDTAASRAYYKQEIQRVGQTTEGAAEAYGSLGKLAFSDNPLAALDAYAHAVELERDNVDSWNQSGLLLSRISKWDQAISAYSIVLELDTSKPASNHVSLR